MRGIAVGCPSDVPRRPEARTDTVPSRGARRKFPARLLLVAQPGRCGLCGPPWALAVASSRRTGPRCFWRVSLVSSGGPSLARPTAAGARSVVRCGCRAALPASLRRAGSGADAGVCAPKCAPKCVYGVCGKLGVATTTLSTTPSLPTPAARGRVKTQLLPAAPARQPANPSPAKQTCRIELLGSVITRGEAVNPHARRSGGGLAHPLRESKSARSTP